MTDLKTLFTNLAASFPNTENMQITVEVDIKDLPLVYAFMKEEFKMLAIPEPPLEIGGKTKYLSYAYRNSFKVDFLIKPETV